MALFLLLLSSTLQSMCCLFSRVLQCFLVYSYSLFLTPNFSVIHKIKVFAVSNKVPPILYKKPKATHDTDIYLSLLGSEATQNLSLLSA